MIVASGIETLGKVLVEVLFQGDNLSPFLFVLALIHPTMAQMKMMATYEFRSEDHL